MKTSELFIFTIIRIILNTAYRMIYPFLRIFGQGLGVGVADITNLIATRAFIGVFYPLIFPFLEPRGRKFGMLLGMGFFIISMGVVVFFPGYTSFGISLVLTLAGKAIFDPSLASYVSDHTEYKQRGSKLAVLEFAWSLAFILGVPAVGLMIQYASWSMPFSVFGILGAGAFIYIVLMLKDSRLPEHHEDGVWGNVKAIFTSRTTLVAMSIGLSVTASNEVVNLMFGVWLEDSFKLQVAALSAATAFVGLSELSGEGLVFWFVDRLGKVRACGVGILANCIAALILPAIGQTQTGALIGLFLFYITFEFTIVSIIPLLSEVMPLARATTLSFAGAGHSIGRTIGALLAPTLYAFGFSYITGAAILFNFLGLLAVWYVSKHHD